MAKLPELELAVDGVFLPEQAAKLKIIRQHYDDLEIRKAELERLILALAVKNKVHCNAELYRKADLIPINREITVEQAVLLAQFHGYRIKAAS